MEYWNAVCIPLTKGMHTIIDIDDFENISRFKWYVHKGYSKWYASRSEWQSGSKRQRQIFMHNVIFGDIPSKHFVDHHNGDGLDNRRFNYRIATRGQNRGNAKKTANRFGTPTSSKYKGVCWDKNNKRWHAHIRTKEKFTYLGLYKREEDAAMAYNFAALEYFGEFALLNKAGNL